MDVFKIDPNTYLGGEMVRGWTNMVWTERYLPAGEFELRTPRVDYTRALLPEETLIAVRDSAEVMQVETHEIETNDDGVDELKVTGRTIEAPWLESRHVFQAPYKKTAKMQGNSGTYNAITAAAAVVWDCLMNNTSNSILTFPVVVRYSSDYIPNLQVTLTRAINQTAEEWWFENGPAYPLVTDFLSRYGAGIRTIRPPYTPSGTTAGTNAITFLYSGEATSVNQASTKDKLKIDFYVGVDRSENQQVNTPVIFDYARGHLDRARYLFSSQALKNTAHVVGANSDGTPIATTVFSDPVNGPNLTGRARRWIYIDAGQAEVPQSAGVPGFLEQKGEIELSKYNRIAAMESAITAKSPAKYGVDYALGDWITLRGNYGLKQTMMVSEYVRTSNGTVDQGYPTLVLPT